MGEDGQGSEGDDKNDTDSQSNSLSGWHPDLLVLLGVAPISKVERVRLQQDFTILVVCSIDNVVNEVAVSLFVFLIQRIHVLGHARVVGQVHVALGAAVKEGSAHGNNSIERRIGGLLVLSVDSLSGVHLLVHFFFVFVLDLIVE